MKTFIEKRLKFIEIIFPSKTFHFYVFKKNEF
jgi:hypothetical protein